MTPSIREPVLRKIAGRPLHSDARIAELERELGYSDACCVRTGPPGVVICSEARCSRKPKFVSRSPAGLRAASLAAAEKEYAGDVAARWQRELTWAMALPALVTVAWILVTLFVAHG
jgi:hypothetical protein